MSQPGEPQSADDFFGPAAQGSAALPIAGQQTPDSFFGPANETSGSAHDGLWGQAEFWGGKILNAFGGEDQHQLPDGSPFEKDQKPFLETVKAAVLRPAVAGLNAQWSRFWNDYSEGAKGAIEAYQAQNKVAAEGKGLGADLDSLTAVVQLGGFFSGIAKYVAGDPVYAQAKAFGASDDFARALGDAATGTAMLAIPGPKVREALATTQRASQLGVIGKGEAGFYDVEPQEGAGKAQAAADLGANVELNGERVRPSEGAAAARGAIAEAAQQAAPDIHTLALEMEPDLIGRYVRLNAEKQAGIGSVDTDLALRGLAPEVSAVYRRAAELLPSTPEEVNAPFMRTEARPEAAETAKAQDADTMAREFAPAAFQQRDALLTRHATYQRWLEELSAGRAENPQVTDLRNSIETILGKVGGNEERLTKAAAGRLAEARAQLADLESSGQTHLDTPDMAFVRGKLLETTHALWDLAPEVRAAYQRAGAQATEAAPETEAAAPVPATEKPLPPELLGNGPQKTIVDLHEQDAERTLPEHAADMADVMRAEIDERAKEVAPEVHNELPAKAEAGRITRENAPLSGRGNEAGPAAGENRGPAGTGTKPAGRNETPAEGAGVRESTRGSGRTIKSVEGTGPLRTRGLSEHVEAKAIENELTDSFGELPAYRQVSMADQAAKAAGLISENPELARDIAMGRKAAPAGVLPESVFVAVEKQAIANRDVETLRDLATKSRLATEATTMGQRIRTLGERDPTSPVPRIEEVQRAREAALAQKGAGVAQEARNIGNDVRRQIKATAPKIGDWQAFLSSIKCAE